MACEIKTQEAVSDIVCDVISNMEGKDVKDTTRFEEDLGVDSDRREEYYDPVKEQVKARGCNLEKTKPSDFSKASNKTVGSVVKVIWDKDIKPQVGPALDAFMALPGRESFVELQKPLSSDVPKVDTETVAYLRGYRDAINHLVDLIVSTNTASTGHAEGNG